MANSSSCFFPSIIDILNQAEAGQLNITTTVASCPDICTLAWGTGNPDLSGIGANISYIFQAVLTFLFGPLFCLVYKRWKFSKRTTEHLEKLQDSFLDISAQFSIPVAVAAVIRFRQHAPFYETAFLRSLTTMQFLSLLSTAVTAGIFEKRHDWKRITVICLYGLVDFGFLMGLIGGLYTSEASWETISELSDACTAYGKILPGYQYIPKAHVHLPHLSAKQVFWDWSGASWKFDGIIAGFVAAATAALVVACFITCWVFMCLWSQSGWVLGIMSVGFTIGTIVEVVEMERTRNVMRAVTGPEFEDNQWGFGQVIALFLWLPLCIQAIYYAIRELSLSRFLYLLFDIANRV